MTYLEFDTAIRQSVFADGEAENLVERHRNHVLDAVIKVQQRVEYWQQKHYDIIPFEQTLWNCGATVFSAPRGFILGCSTIDSGDWCGKVDYDPVDVTEFRRMMADQDVCGCPVDEPYGYYDTGGGVYAAFPTLQLGSAYAEDDTDKSARSTCGVYTLKDCQIWVWPHIQSTESVVLEWAGIKRSYADSDVVTFDREVEEAVEIYVEAQAARHDDKDEISARAIMDGFNDKIGDMIWQHRKEQRLPQRPYHFTNC